MINGLSGLNVHLNPIMKSKNWNRSLKYENVNFYMFSANNPDSLRGFQFDLVWIDELCKMKKGSQLLEQIWMSLRLGDAKLIISTTPMSSPILEEIISRDDTLVIRQTTYDNSSNLADSFLNDIKKYEETDFGKQEILGEIVKSFQKSNINYHDYDENEHFYVGIDPAVVGGTTGIIVTQFFNNKWIVVEDLSTNQSFNIWLEKIQTRMEGLQYTVIIEKNQGGNLWYKMLEPLKTKVILQRAKTSKSYRQQYLQQLYKRKILYNFKSFGLLEHEILYNPKDRVDALFWAISCPAKKPFFMINEKEFSNEDLKKETNKETSSTNSSYDDLLNNEKNHFDKDLLNVERNSFDKNLF
jgi:phage terminase large subunit-like protein